MQSSTCLFISPFSKCLVETKPKTLFRVIFYLPNHLLHFSECQKELLSQPEHFYHLLKKQYWRTSMKEEPSRFSQACRILTENIASVVTAAVCRQGWSNSCGYNLRPRVCGASHQSNISPVCVSSVDLDPSAFLAAVQAGASMLEIGNYDSFYEKAGFGFLPRTARSITLSVTVPHTLSLPDQVKLAEQLELEGVDVIQTGGKCTNPSKSGVLGLIEKASPALAAAHSIFRAVKIMVMRSSGLSAVTPPMEITAGAAGMVCNQLNPRLGD